MNEDQEPAHAGIEAVALAAPTTEDKEAARKRARELDDAIYAALTCRAQSDQARALVDEVMRLSVAHVPPLHELLMVATILPVCCVSCRMGAASGNRTLGSIARTFAAVTIGQ